MEGGLCAGYIPEVEPVSASRGGALLWMFSRLGSIQLLGVAPVSSTVLEYARQPVKRVALLSIVGRKELSTGSARGRHRYTLHGWHLPLPFPY
jgi:hypothetical protein